MGQGRLTLHAVRTEGTRERRVVEVDFTVLLEWEDPAIEEEVALKALYGPSDETGLRAWRHPALGDGHGPVKAHILQILPFDRMGQRQALVLTQVNEPANGCHSCVPGLGAAIFTLNEGSWGLTRAIPFITSLGHSGWVPQARLLFLESGRLGLLFRVSDDHQGVSHEHAILLAEQGGSFTPVLTVMPSAAASDVTCYSSRAERTEALRAARREKNPKERSDELAFANRRPDCWSFDSTFTLRAGPGGGSPELEVLTAGTKSRTWNLAEKAEWDEGPIAPFRMVRRYQFRQGAFHDVR
ncbi:MAG: hypothetical protein HYZ13_03470 [Acidobacteria bacterium]|nr:hypothetical protein [Acidobacteriota bacterium]